MRMVFGLVLVVGLALAGFAVYMAQGFISQTQAELEMERAASAKAGPLVEVFVVNKPLNYGDPLTKEDVQASAKKYLPADKMYIVVVGDNKELPALRALGYPVVELNMEGQPVAAEMMMMKPMPASTQMAAPMDEKMKTQTDDGGKIKTKTKKGKS